MTSTLTFHPYGPSFSTREAALDALEGYYATGEISSEERTRIEKVRGRHVVLVMEGFSFD